MKLKATVLVPTYDHGPTLWWSVGSALAQSVEDLEVLIVGDGAGDATRRIVGELMRRDARVRFFDHSKGPRHGEVYRHEALRQARGEIVCCLADDDLWLPNHVETMCGLLERADFAHALPLRIGPNGIVGVWSMDGDLPYYRELILRGKNRVPFSCAAHTLSMYQTLPHGWRTTPPDIYTDLFMWQQFLEQRDCRLASGSRPTVLHFPSTQRTEWTPDQRLDELDAWAAKLADSEWQREFALEVLDAVVRDRACSEARMTERADSVKREIEAIRQSVTVRVRERIRQVPWVEPALRSLVGVLAGARAR